MAVSSAAMRWLRLAFFFAMEERPRPKQSSAGDRRSRFQLSKKKFAGRSEGSEASSTVQIFPFLADAPILIACLAIQSSQAHRSFPPAAVLHLNVDPTLVMLIRSDEDYLWIGVISAVSGAG